MTKRTKEVRLTQIRALEDTKLREMIIEGYAVVFNSPSDVIDNEWVEYIDKNAFDECDMKDVVLRYNHKDDMLVMAKTRNKSLTLEIDEKGLKIQANLIDTTQNRDIYKSVKEGLIDKMSFRFTVKEDEWDYSKSPAERKILKFDKLFDVSVVDEPAYEQTEIYARSIDEVKEEKQKYINDKLEFEKEKLKILLSI